MPLLLSCPRKEEQFPWELGGGLAEWGPEPLPAPVPVPCLRGAAAPGDTAVHSGSLGVSPWWRAAVTPQVTCPLSRPIHRHRGGRYRCPPSPMSQMVEQPPCTLAWRPRSQVSAGPSTPSLGPAGPALCLSVLSALAALATPAAQSPLRCHPHMSPHMWTVMLPSTLPATAVAHATSSVASEHGRPV